MYSSLHVLQNGQVQFGTAQICKQKDRIGLHKPMILAIDPARIFRFWLQINVCLDCFWYCGVTDLDAYRSCGVETCTIVTINRIYRVVLAIKTSRDLMNIDTPTFGSEPDWNKSKIYGSSLRIEMLWCTDVRGDQSKSVNVLHASTDLESANSSMDRFILLMKEMGFDCRRESGLNTDASSGLGADIDVVIVGSDQNHSNNANYFIQRIALGFLEIVPELDVLWYGTDYTPQQPQDMNLQCSNRAFSVEAACLVHSHARRRKDIAMWRGLCVSMLLRIEDIIDGMLNTWNREAWKKIHMFEDRIRKDGRWGPDADLFFAAVAVILDARNVAAHTQDNMPAKKRQEQEAISKNLTDCFNKLAEMHRRPYLKFKHNISIPDRAYKRLKWMNGIAQIATTWIYKYSQLPPKKS